MNKTDVEKYELIRYAHSRIHDPELIESASVLAVSDKNTVEDLLTVEENSAQMILPNLLYLGLKKIINNTTGDLSIHKADKTIRAKTGFPESGRYSTLSAYLKNLYLLSAEPENFSPDAIVLPSDTSDNKIPKIDIVPPSVLKIEKFPTAVFSHFSIGSEKVQLLWQSSHTDKIQRTTLDNQTNNRRESALLLDYGTYLFSYKTGNMIYPPPGYTKKIGLLKTGIFAFYYNKKPSPVIRLINRSKETVYLSLTSKESWLNTEYILLQPLQKKRVVLDIVTEKLEPGINKGQVDLCFLSKTKSRKIKSFNTEIDTEIKGVVPLLKCKLKNRQNTSKNIFDITLDITISLQGEGSLSGMILLPQIGKQFDFRSDDAARHSTIEYNFSIPSEKLPLCGNALTVVLISDCYHANRRIQQQQIAFQTVLKKSLPALIFRKFAFR